MKNASNYDLQVDIARDIFLKYDQEQLIRKFSLASDAQWIYLTYLNIPFRINRKDGQIEEYHDRWLECRSFSTVMTIYDLLCYHKGESAPALARQWCTVGTFVLTGVTNTETFTKQYSQLFDCHVDELKAACEKLGAIAEPRMVGADLTYRFSVTSFFPVLLQFWKSDDEFPAKLLLLWDRNSNQFLHFETTFYLQGDLLERIRKNIEEWL